VHQAFERRRREYIDKLSDEAKEQGFILQFSRSHGNHSGQQEGEPMTQDDLRI